MNVAMPTRGLMTPELMTAAIHSTIAAPAATWLEILDFADRTKSYGFPVLAVQGCWARDVRQVLKGSTTKVSVFVGHSLGGSPVRANVTEVTEGLAAGAEMFEYLPNLGFLRTGLLSRFKEELAAVVGAAEGRPVCAYFGVTSLNTDECIRAAGLAEAAGVRIICGAGGWGIGSPATEQGVRMLRTMAGERVGIKAAGSIDDLDSALRMMASGADCLGTSSGFRIIDELKKRRPKR